MRLVFAHLSDKKVVLAAVNVVVVCRDLPFDGGRRKKKTKTKR